MKLQIHQRIDEIPAEEWDALNHNNYPFTQHAMLLAMEDCGCLGERHGWLPHHLTVRNAQGQLIAAMPLYLKDNSYGEFVFDWGWADAYQRNGLQYYPKLVCAIPYTPAPGPRLLIQDDEQGQKAAEILIQGSIELAKELNASSLHFLFTQQADTQRLLHHGLMPRMGVQFHWHNDGFSDFDDFLSRFSAKKRKNVRQERNKVKKQNIAIEIRHGDEMEDQHWETIYHYYCDTFYRKSGYPTFTLEFFKRIGEKMPRQIVILFAKHEGSYVAGAICYRSDTHFYGRHWGCDEDFDSLHFELCYYQGIEYCIDNGLQTFEPGAQGEHKISRGFVPTPTWSAHWISHPGFRKAIGDFLGHEKGGMDHYIETLNEHLPFKQEDS